MNYKIITLAVICLLSTPIVFASKEEYDSKQEHIIFNQYEIELEAWIEKLAKCESGNNEKAINQHDGGSRSVGYVQYKDDTWRRYNAKFNLPYSAEDIWSKEAQIAVTKEVIRQDYAYKNWWNCTLKVGKPPISPGAQ